MLKVLISLALVALCAAQSSKLPTPIPFATPKPVLTTVPVRNPMYLPATQFQQGHFVNQQNQLLYPIRNPIFSNLGTIFGGLPYFGGPTGGLPLVGGITSGLPLVGGITSGLPLVGGITSSLPLVGGITGRLPIVGNTGIRHPVKYVPQATTFTTTATMRKPMLQTMMPQNLNNLNPQRNYVQNYGTPYYGSNYVYPTSSEFGYTGYSYPTNYGYPYYGQSYGTPYYGQSYGTPYYGNNYAYQSSPVLGTYGYNLEELPSTTTFAPPLETMA